MRVRVRSTNLEVEIEDGLLHVLRALLQPGHLGEYLVVDGLVGLDTDDQLVLWLLAEEALRWRLLELDPDESLRRLQRLARLEDERHARPSLVIEVQHRHGEGRAARRVALARVDLLNVGVLLVALILPHLARLGRYGSDLLEHLDLLVAHVFRAKGRGGLHRH